MKNRAQFSLPAILLESFLVVLGVALAFAANEWREHRREEARAANALVSIQDEIQTNRAAVQSSMEYHQRLLGDLYRLAQSEPEAVPKASDFERGFIGPATVLSTAWDSARSTDALRHMAYRDVLRLSSVYAEQERYLLQQRTVGQTIYDRLLADGTDGLLRDYRHLLILISTFQYREIGLLKTYDQALGLPPAEDSTPGRPPAAQATDP